MGQPEAVKALFVANATDLRRDPTFQGSGLIDIMRTIQAV
jgi:serine protease AprX